MNKLIFTSDMVSGFVTLNVGHFIMSFIFYFGQM
jgi:hypothetical protein